MRPDALLIRLLLLAPLLVGPGLTAATVHVLDPAQGTTLEAAVREGRLHAGDTAVLRSGYHGSVVLAGANAAPITIVAEPGQVPQLGRLTISGASWRVRGLVISPSLAPEPYKGTIVSLGEKEPGSDLVVEDCFIYGALDSSAWTVEQWMSANSGLQFGRNGSGLVARNNHLLNLRFGVQISAPGAICEGNIVENFSADGVRVTRDDITVRGNTIKNVHVGSGDGDDNHDDGIQAFLFNKGTGIVRKARIADNLIVNREDPAQRFPASLQGIGFFDGPLIGFAITGNVVDVTAWHGIALYDAQGCTISGNAVFNTIDDRKPWIMLGEKHKQTRDNTVTGNFSGAYKLKSPGLVQDGNAGLSAADFRATQLALQQRIEAEFGPHHPLTGLPRLGAPGNRVKVTGYRPFVAVTAGAKRPRP